ncbi:hypothetical protein Pla8534_36350 [Lignipirellula cremea]|uniref:Uncharacterized protein n=1 Tax=Lignipirellula cremea TaxID=2528010 RepID=A0A518DVF6_9BACT|nr:hypothetical protein Pla8534_36350 [Lignipirellula cremea]
MKTSNLRPYRCCLMDIWRLRSSNVWACRAQPFFIDVSENSSRAADPWRRRSGQGVRSRTATPGGGRDILRNALLFSAAAIERGRSRRREDSQRRRGVRLRGHSAVDFLGASFALDDDARGADSASYALRHGNLGEASATVRLAKNRRRPGRSRHRRLSKNGRKYYETPGIRCPSTEVLQAPND